MKVVSYHIGAGEPKLLQEQALLTAAPSLPPFTLPNMPRSVQAASTQDAVKTSQSHHKVFPVSDGLHPFKVGAKTDLSKEGAGGSGKMARW